MNRGDLVIVSVAGDYGKPRPALVVQSDYFNEGHASVTVIPVTSTLVDAPLFRLTLEPTAGNGLRSISQLMVDKITTVPRSKLGQCIGRLADQDMVRLGRAVVVFFGLAGS